VLVHELGPTIFELHFPSYRVFLLILMVQYLYFYVNLFAASISVSLAWKQHVLMVLYGPEYEVLKYLS